MIKLLILTSLLSTGIWSQEITSEVISDWDEYSREFLQELNLARTQPQKYAEILETEFLPRLYKGPGEEKEIFVLKFKTDEDQRELVHRKTMNLNEGAAPFHEALEFLKNQKALSELGAMPGMNLGALDHVKDMGASGELGHDGNDGSNFKERLERYGLVTGISGEVIMAGDYLSPREMVMFLIVDDGVPSRGHRESIFTAEFRVAGAQCGPHYLYKRLCVADFAAGYWNDLPNQESEESKVKEY